MEGLLGRFLSFDKMIAGFIIKILYYILLVALVIGFVVVLFQNLIAGKFLILITGPLGFLISLLLLRIICELYIVLFRISDNLAAIKKLKEGGGES